jgi:endonuclease-3
MSESRATGWKREDIIKMLNLIQSQSPPHHFEFHDPFWVLITTIMSHRTRDEVTDAAARNLFNKYGDSEHLSKADYQDVLKLIGNVGFMTVKAQRVIDAARIVEEKFGGNVPDSMEDLMTIPGVGRKTASVVLADSFGIPAIAVDTHVHRVSNRIGWANSKNPEDTEEQLKSLIPKEKWVGFNPMMVEFGKKICRPVGPKCNECLINAHCRYYMKIRQDSA